jgi:Na+/H+ antiporter NhaD/arsenite permease-like protein
MAFLSNIGGVGTLIGDPPNIIIASASGLGFNDFIIHLLPPVTIVAIVTLFVLTGIFWKELKRKPKDINHLFLMDEKEAIRETRGLKRCLVVVGGVILLFFLHQLLEISPSMVALLGGALILLLLRPDPDEVFKDIDWSTIFFFGALFVLIGGIRQTALLTYISSVFSGLAKKNIVLSMVFLLWISAFASSWIGNILLTLTMIPVIKGIASSGINVNPLWWSLAMGAGFGGNGSPIGSAVGIVAISISEKTRYPITFRKWIKIGGIVMLSSCGISTLFLTLFPGFFR